MKRFLRKNPGFSLLMLSILLFSGLGIGYGLNAVNKTKQTKELVVQLKEELGDLLAANPVPTEENLEISNDGLQEMEQRQKLFSEVLQKMEFKAKTEGVYGSTDLNFELQAYVDDLKLKARRLGIELDEDCYFGFKRYVETNALPPKEAGSMICLQRDVLSYLLYALYDARPKSILFVEREAVESSFLGSAHERDEETFVLASHLRLRVDEAINSFGVRFCFAGRTQVLRHFLNRLSEPDFPVFARSVEVELAEENSGMPMFEDAEEPLVVSSVLIFTVTLQFLELDTGAFMTRIL